MLRAKVWDTHRIHQIHRIHLIWRRQLQLGTPPAQHPGRPAGPASQSELLISICQIMNSGLCSLFCGETMGSAERGNGQLENGTLSSLFLFEIAPPVCRPLRAGVSEARVPYSLLSVCRCNHLSLPNIGSSTVHHVWNFWTAVYITNMGNMSKIT